ncbi:hypothetical protein RclHR1_11610003 [Rhizophagus clarus]|uniref:U11/U12 small nuclear ribonucleoprotein 59 kDa protein n=1 Tax=Rhizophagus clarus TaxID=94130 RepID=A0A2Z6Q4I8_9GLOM|nr:hypothetical protein RclHR1_11610003 [Rhizophagus clarus]GET01794.1 U11/U12 small nuclear ribonucleoprotein 59 kDa protein [Rhizophagus clarus]
MSSQQSQQPYSCNPPITHQYKSPNFSQPQQFSHNPPAGVTLEPVNSFKYTTSVSYEFYNSCSFPLDGPTALPNTNEVEGPPGVNRAVDGETKKTINVQQAWLKSWIKSRNVKLEESVPKLPNITNTREQILQTHYLLQDMKSKLDKLKEIREIANEDEWKVNIESLENFKKNLESNLSYTTDQKYIEKIKLKLSKVRRHQKWRKKHIKKLQSVRDERQRRRETLHKTIDEWRTEWIAKELALKREQARKEEAEKRVQEAEAKKSEHKELTKLLEKVKKLRDLRRERLKREGHFFPEEDDEFFNKIASLNDVMKVEEARLDQERNAAAEHKRNEAMNAGMKERERERDPVYEYWHQAEFDLDNLVLIRRQWDAYINETGSSCIPLTFVDPSPPANYIWASCLTHE